MNSTNSPTTTCSPNLFKCKMSEVSDNEVASRPDPVDVQTLYVPSEIPPQVCCDCHPGLDDIRWQLRDAQCWTSLDSIYMHLYMKVGLITYKQCHVRHQGRAWRKEANVREAETKQGELSGGSRAVGGSSQTIMDLGRCWKRSRLINRLAYMRVHYRNTSNPDPISWPSALYQYYGLNGQSREYRHYDNMKRWLY